MTGNFGKLLDVDLTTKEIKHGKNMLVAMNMVVKILKEKIIFL